MSEVRTITLDDGRTVEIRKARWRDARQAARHGMTQFGAAVVAGVVLVAGQAIVPEDLDDLDLDDVTEMMDVSGVLGYLAHQQSKSVGTARPKTIALSNGRTAELVRRPKWRDANHAGRDTNGNVVEFATALLVKVFEIDGKPITPEDLDNLYLEEVAQMQSACDSGKYQLGQMSSGLQS